MDWHSIPSLAALRAYEAAARHRSLSAAARELNVTHAAIAQHVRALEQVFSEALLVRQGRGVVPTPIGRDLADGLAEGFQTIAETVKGLHDRGHMRPLNIAATPSFAGTWLMPRIGDFWARHPSIQLNINPSTTLVDLRQDGFDMALRFGDGNWPGLDSELLSDTPYWAVARPDLIGARVANSLHDLTDLPWLLNAHELERQRVIADEQIDLSQVQVTMLNTSDLVFSATLAGLGIAFLPSSMVEREISLGQLVRLYTLRDAGLGYHMVTVPGRVSPNLRTFMTWLRRKAADEKTPGDAGAS